MSGIDLFLEVLRKLQTQLLEVLRKLQTQLVVFLRRQEKVMVRCARYNAMRQGTDKLDLITLYQAHLTMTGTRTHNFRGDMD